MVTNYSCTISGIFKILTVIGGSVAFGLGAYSYDETIVQEEFFLRAVQTALIISVIYLGIYLAMSTKLESSDTALAIDIAFHLSSAITLLIAGSLVIYSAVDNERTYCQLIYTVFPYLFCQFYGIKMAAGMVTLFNGVLYWVTAATVFLSRNPVPYKIKSHQLRNPIFSIPVDMEKKTKYGTIGPKPFYYAGGSKF